MFVWYMFQGLKNDFKAAMDEVDQQYLNELVQSSGQSDEAVAKAADVKTRDDGTTIEDIQVGNKLCICDNNGHMIRYMIIYFILYDIN